MRGARHNGPVRSGRRQVFAITVVIQLVVLYWPHAPSPPTTLPVDKLVHLSVFAAVAWTGRRAGIPLRPLLAALLAHAVISELLQAWVIAGRDGDPRDVLADWSGTLLALALAAWSGRRAGRGSAPRGQERADASVGNG